MTFLWHTFLVCDVNFMVLAYNIAIRIMYLVLKTQQQNIARVAFGIKRAITLRIHLNKLFFHARSTNNYALIYPKEMT